MRLFEVNVLEVVGIDPVCQEAFCGNNGVLWEFMGDIDHEF